jgi:hypothetical protein
VANAEPFRDHFCSTVQAQGWSGVRNSELLKRAEADFDLLITADQNIVYQLKDVFSEITESY